MLTAFVLSATTIAGCGEAAPEPDPLEKPDRTEEKQASATPTPSKSPSLEGQQQAAIQTVKDWQAASNQAKQTLDPAAMLALSADDCKACRFRARDLRKMKAAGQRYEGDFQEVFVDGEPSAGTDPLRITVTTRVGDWRIVGKDGTVEKVVPAEQRQSQYQMKLKEGQWLVAEVMAAG